MKIEEIFKKSIEQLENVIERSTNTERRVTILILDNPKSVCFGLEFEIINNNMLEAIFTYCYAKDVLQNTIPQDILKECLNETIKQLENEKKENEEDD